MEDRTAEQVARRFMSSAWDGTDERLLAEAFLTPEKEPPQRFAVVHARSRARAEAFLGGNYKVLTDHDADPFGNFKNCVIQGYDEGTWTLEVIIESYSTGGMRCREHADRNDAETAACSAMN